MDEETLLQRLKREKKDPFVYGLEERDLKFLEWLSSQEIAIPNLTYVLEHLIGQYGDIEIEYLDWFDQNYPQYRERFYEELWHEAVSLRNKEVIAWLQVRKYDPMNLETTVQEALGNVDLRTLKFLSETDYIKDIFNSKGELTEKAKLRIAYLNPRFDHPRYSQTKRPVTRMAFAENHCQSGALYLPVVRYEELYFGISTSKSQICGTFYFYEPDSENFLNLGRCLVAANKVDALTKLNGSPDETAFIELLSYKLTSKELRKLGKDVVKLPEYEEVHNFLSTIIANEKDLDNHTLAILDIYLPRPGKFKELNSVYEVIDNSGKNYIGVKFVGHFDDLDQSICQLAQKAGYDTVLLQREPGEERTVTEILDVRTRIESYASLCREKFRIQTHTTSYPTIWFSEYGFMTY